MMKIVIWTYVVHWMHWESKEQNTSSVWSVITVVWCGINLGEEVRYYSCYQDANAMCAEKDVKMEIIRPNGAKELTMGDQKEFFNKKNAALNIIPPYFPQWNGLAEPANLTIFGKTSRIISDQNIMWSSDGYKNYWHDTFNASYTLTMEN